MTIAPGDPPDAEAYPCRTVPSRPSLRVYLLAPSGRRDRPAELLLDLVRLAPEEHRHRLLIVNTSRADGKRVAACLYAPDDCPYLIGVQGRQHLRLFLPDDLSAAYSRLFNFLRIYAPSR